MFWHGVPSFLDLDAAVWFRQSGNLRGLLSGAVRKNLVESFRIHAAFLGNSANRGWSAFLLVNAAHEADHRPVMVGKAANADRKSTRLNSSHLGISYAVFCLKK